MAHAVLHPQNIETKSPEEGTGKYSPAIAVPPPGISTVITSSSPHVTISPDSVMPIPYLPMLSEFTVVDSGNILTTGPPPT